MQSGKNDSTGKSNGQKNSTTEELLTPRGLERRIKRHLSKKQCSFLAITVPGFEHILKNELAVFPDVIVAGTVEGGVEFYGPIDTVYHANLRLRTANRVLLRIDSFTARSYPELYNKAKKTDWELYCGFSKSVAFSVSSKTSRLHHTANIEKAVFEGLCDRMVKLGVNVTDEKNAQVKFHIRFADDTCTISIDSSGELLYRRGYRTHVAHAPIRETTAAALLMAAEWDKYHVIADPMCGSGVFAFEAYLMSRNNAPGVKRDFAFYHWPSFNSGKWEKIRNNSLSGEASSAAQRIIASDIDSEAVNCANVNAANIGCGSNVEISLANCMDFNSDGRFGDNGLVISNLPYGKRVGDASGLHDLYRELGNHYRRCCRGWHFGFVSSELQFPQISRFRVEKEIRFVNGGIPVSFFTGTF